MVTSVFHENYFEKGCRNLFKYHTMIGFQPFDLESVKSTSSVHGVIAHIPEKLSHVPPEMFTDVPERVVQLVEEMLDKGREPTTSKNQPKLSKSSSFK